MNLGEFIAAAIIAAYAMLGSALFSAALTKPENCLRATEALIRPVWFYGGVILLAFGVVALGFLPFNAKVASAFADPVSIIIVANYVLLGILYAARWIARRLLAGR